MEHKIQTRTERTVTLTLTEDEARVLLVAIGAAPFAAVTDRLRNRGHRLGRDELTKLNSDLQPLRTALRVNRPTDIPF